MEKALIDHFLQVVYQKVRVERVQVEIASGAGWHPGADLYSFTKVGINYCAFCKLSCQDPVWEVSRDLIHLKEEIGQGAFGLVRKAEVEF